MNYPHSGTVTATGKKNRFSSAARALVLGLALVLPGTAALATPGTPIQGIPIGLEGDPEGIRVGTTTTDKNGAFNFGKLPAGKYKIILDGQRVQTINVGANRSISGVLSSDGGKASITFNGQVGVVPDEPAGAPVNTSRSNKKAGIAVGDVNGDGRAEIRTVPPKTDGTGKPQFKVADNENPRPTDRAFLDGNASLGIIVGAGAGGGPHASQKGSDEKPGISETNSAMGTVSTTRGTALRPDSGGGQEQSTVRKAGGRPPEEYGTASPPKPEGDKLPGLAGEPIKGGMPPPVVVPGTLAITKDAELPGKTGHAPKPVSPGTGTHRSLKAGEPTPEDGKPAARVAVITVIPVNDAPSKAADPIPPAFGQQVTFTATVAPINPANNPPGIAGTPIQGTPIGLEGDPGSIKVSATTGPDGAYQFTGLPVGKYKLTFPGLDPKPITIGTNGKTGGKVLRDGNNVIVTGDFEGSPARSKASANPVPSFLGGVFPGIGSVMGGILPGMGPSAVGPGAGPMSPAAGPMSPGGPMGASPMGPGAGAIRR